MQNFTQSRCCPVHVPHWAATDPVGGPDHSLPIRPEQGSSKPLEFWQDLLYKQRPRKRNPRQDERKPRDDNHQVDDYA